MSHQSSDPALMEPAIIETLSSTQCELWLGIRGIPIPPELSSEEELRKLVSQHAGLEKDGVHPKGSIDEILQSWQEFNGSAKQCDHDVEFTGSTPEKITINELPDRALTCLFGHLSGQRSGRSAVFGTGAEHRPLAEANKKFLKAFYQSIISLRIENIAGKDNHIIGVLSRYGTNLENLTLHQCPYVTDASLASLQIYCPKLISLEISMMKRILDAGIKHFAEAYGGQLRRVKLTKCTLFTHECLESLGEYCNLLSGLILCRIPSDVGDKGLCVLLKNVGANLNLLSIDDCEGVSDKSLMTGSIYCPNLKSVVLRGLRKITNRGVIALTDKVGARLEKLDLSRSVNVSDMTIAWIGKRNSNLKVVKLSGLSLIGDEGVCEMCELLSDSLEQLDISLNPNITDASLVTVGKQNLNLTHLCAARVTRITDYGVVALCRGLGADLRTLDISYNCNISSAIFDTIFCRNVNLKRLNISGKNKITGRGLRKIQDTVGNRFQLVCK